MSDCARLSFKNDKISDKVLFPMETLLIGTVPYINDLSASVKPVAKWMMGFFEANSRTVKQWRFMILAISCSFIS